MHRWYSTILVLGLLAGQNPALAEQQEQKMETVANFRVARPTNDLAQLRGFYVGGLGLDVIAEFKGHDGFDGLILGLPDGKTQLEFTVAHGHVAPRSPTLDHLIVFYLDDPGEYEAALSRMQDQGYEPVPSFNPYWNIHGETFEDPEGYRVVLVRGAFPLK